MEEFQHAGGSCSSSISFCYNKRIDRLFYVRFLENDSNFDQEEQENGKCNTETDAGGMARAVFFAGI